MNLWLKNIRPKNIRSLASECPRGYYVFHTEIAPVN
jgi:hypothetical protein